MLGKLFKKFWWVLVIPVGYVLLTRKGGENTDDDEAYRTIADIQWNCMDRIGTNEKLLFQSLEGLSPEELIKVYQHFGRKGYGTIAGLEILGSKIDLFGWYEEELDHDEKVRMREIWKDTGLKITFF